MGRSSGRIRTALPAYFIRNIKQKKGNSSTIHFSPQFSPFLNFNWLQREHKKSTNVLDRLHQHPVVHTTIKNGKNQLANLFVSLNMRHALHDNAQGIHQSAGTALLTGGEGREVAHEVTDRLRLRLTEIWLHTTKSP